MFEPSVACPVADLCARPMASDQQDRSNAKSPEKFRLFGSPSKCALQDRLLAATSRCRQAEPPDPRCGQGFLPFPRPTVRRISAVTLFGRSVLHATVAPHS